MFSLLWRTPLLVAHGGGIPRVQGDTVVHAYGELPASLLLGLRGHLQSSVGKHGSPLFASVTVGPSAHRRASRVCNGHVRQQHGGGHEQAPRTRAHVTASPAHVLNA